MLNIMPKIITRITTIGSICDEFGGEVQTGPFGSQLHASDYSSNGTPVVMPQDMADGRVVCDRIARVSEQHVRRLSRHQLQVGDIVFSRRGDVGRFAVITENEKGWLCGTGSIRIRLNCPDVTVGYLRRYLQQETVGEWLAFHAKGVTMPNLNTTILRNLPIVFPPLEEQRRIAAFLDEADALRAKRRVAMAQIDELARAIFVEMFGDPAKNERNWPHTSFGELIIKGPQNGLYRPASDYGIGTPILRIDSFYDGKITNFLNLKRVNASPQERDLYGLIQNDIVINRVNSMEYLGKSALITELVEPTVFESNMMRLAVDTNRVLPLFIIKLLQTDFIKVQIRKSAKHAVNQSSINQKDVAEFKIICPPIGRQAEFSARVQEIDRMGELQHHSKDNLDTLFAALQHRAFRGEL